MTGQCRPVLGTMYAAKAVTIRELSPSLSAGKRGPGPPNLAEIFMACTTDEITRLLNSASAGNGEAEEGLLRAVYSELRLIAQSWMARTPPGQTIQPTALVHEAFLRMVGPAKVGWENRAHFFFAASRAMRDILVDRARAKGARKRGGDRQRVDLDRLIVATEAPDEDL